MENTVESTVIYDSRNGNDFVQARTDLAGGNRVFFTNAPQGILLSETLRCRFRDPSLRKFFSNYNQCCQEENVG